MRELLKNIKEELREKQKLAGAALEEIMEIVQRHIEAPVLSVMNEFERIMLSDKVQLVKEGGGSFMLVYLDRNNRYRGDVSFGTSTDSSDLISIAFNPDVKLTTTKVSWNGLVITIAP